MTFNSLKRRNETIAQASRGDVFRSKVIILAKLRDLEPVHSNVFQNLKFLGKVQEEFRALLYQRDQRALWLFGYWFGLMCRFEGVWWCNKRVKRDYRAIRMWLQQLHLTERPGIRGEIWREMMKEFDWAPSLVHV